jgi:hypothetical protein
MRLSVVAVAVLVVASTAPACVVREIASPPVVVTGGCAAAPIDATVPYVMIPPPPPPAPIAIQAPVVPVAPPPQVASDVPTYALGDAIEIHFSGALRAPSGQRYWITLVPASSDDSTWGSWHYVADGATTESLAAASEGDFEIRLHDLYPRFDYKVLTRVRVRVVGRRAAPAAFSIASASICPSTFQSAGGAATCLCTAGAHGAVWGSRIYTADSSICEAARHAGLVGVEGGVVRAEPAPGCSHYTGTFGHGVATSSWGSYHASFVFPAIGGGACER